MMKIEYIQTFTDTGFSRFKLITISKLNNNINLIFYNLWRGKESN